MTDRVVKVNLVAQVQGYLNGMDQAARKTREVGTEAEKLGQKKAGFTELGHAALAVGALAAAGVGLAIAKFAEFDQAMSNVQAATQESAANMGLLRAAALEAGAKTVFTATEAANAIEELGKNGLSTAEILAGGLNGALSLATAGQLGVARAAEIASLSMKQFNLNGKDVPHITDLLAAGAGKAAGDVEDMAQALAQGGLVAHSTGLSIEETTGVLAAFADKALIGSDAGTSLKTMLQRLTPTSEQAQKEMDRLGISAYDASGNFIGAANFAENLKTSLHDLTPEQRNASLAIIFGSDAVRAANVLYDEGAKGIQKYIDQTNDSGYAAKVAADRLNNLAGDVEQLGGSLDTALIQTGSGANDTLRSIVQAATFLVDAIGAIPTPALGAGLAIGAVAAAILLTAGATLTLIPRIAAVKEGMVALGITAKGTALGIGAMAGAVSAATLIIGAFLAAEAQKKQNVDSFTDSLDKATGKVTDYTKELMRNRLESEGVYDAAKQAGVSFDLVNKAASGNSKAFAELKKQAGEYYDSQKTNLPNLINASSNFDKLTDSVRYVSEDLGKAKDAHENLAAAEDATAVKTEALTAATEEATKAQDDWNKMVTDADSSFVDIQGAYDSLIQKNQALAQASADATDDSSDTWQNFSDNFPATVEGYLTELQNMVDAQTNWEKNMLLLSGRVSQGTLDELTRLGPEGAPLVANLVNASDDELARMEGLFAEKTANATGAFADTLNTSAPIIEAAAAQLGQGAADEIATKLANKTETVEQIIREYGLKIEAEHPTVTVNADTYSAEQSLQRVKDALANIDGASAQYTVYGNMVANGSDPLFRRANGGILPGAPSRRDNMLIHAASGEYVVNAQQTAYNRQLLEAINSGRGPVRGYANGGYVSGRDVQYASSSSPVRVASTVNLPPIEVQVAPRGGIDLLKYVDITVRQYDREQTTAHDAGFRGI